MNTDSNQKSDEPKVVKKKKIVVKRRLVVRNHQDPTLHQQEDADCPVVEDDRSETASQASSSSSATTVMSSATGCAMMRRTKRLAPKSYVQSFDAWLATGGHPIALEPFPAHSVRAVAVMPCTVVDSLDDVRRGVMVTAHRHGLMVYCRASGDRGEAHYWDMLQHRTESAFLDSYLLSSLRPSAVDAMIGPPRGVVRSHDAETVYEGNSDDGEGTDTGSLLMSLVVRYQRYVACASGRSDRQQQSVAVTSISSKFVLSHTLHQTARILALRFTLISLIPPCGRGPPAVVDSSVAPSSPNGVWSKRQAVAVPLVFSLDELGNLCVLDVESGAALTVTNPSTEPKDSPSLLYSYVGLGQTDQAVLEVSGPCTTLCRDCHNNISTALDSELSSISKQDFVVTVLLSVSRTVTDQHEDTSDDKLCRSWSVAMVRVRVVLGGLRPFATFASAVTLLATQSNLPALDQGPIPCPSLSIHVGGDGEGGSGLPSVWVGRPMQRLWHLRGCSGAVLGTVVLGEAPHRLSEQGIFVFVEDIGLQCLTDAIQEPQHPPGSYWHVALALTNAGELLLLGRPALSGEDDPKPMTESPLKGPQHPHKQSQFHSLLSHNNKERSTRTIEEVSKELFDKTSLESWLDEVEEPMLAAESKGTDSVAGNDESSSHRSVTPPPPPTVREQTLTTLNVLCVLFRCHEAATTARRANSTRRSRTTVLPEYVGVSTAAGCAVLLFANGHIVTVPLPVKQRPSWLDNRRTAVVHMVKQQQQATESSLSRTYSASQAKDRILSAVSSVFDSVDASLRGPPILSAMTTDATDPSASQPREVSLSRGIASLLLRVTDTFSNPPPSRRRTRRRQVAESTAVEASPRQESDALSSGAGSPQPILEEDATTSNLLKPLVRSTAAPSSISPDASKPARRRRAEIIVYDCRGESDARSPLTESAAMHHHLSSHDMSTARVNDDEEEGPLEDHQFTDLEVMRRQADVQRRIASEWGENSQDASPEVAMSRYLAAVRHAAAALRHLELDSETEARATIATRESQRRLHIFIEYDDVLQAMMKKEKADNAAKEAARVQDEFNSDTAWEKRFAFVDPLQTLHSITVSSAKLMHQVRERSRLSNQRNGSSAWLRQYLTDGTVPDHVLALQEQDRCLFEVAELRLQQEAAMAALGPLLEVVTVTENERRDARTGEWVPFRIPYQSTEGQMIDFERLCAAGEDVKNRLWRWEKVPSSWSEGPWRYAARWPVEEPGSDWTSEDGGRNVSLVRRRDLQRTRIDLKVKYEQDELRKLHALQMSELKDSLGIE